MRAELVAMCTALYKFATHDWVGMFTDLSLASSSFGIAIQTQGLTALNAITTTCSY